MIQIHRTTAANEYFLKLVQDLDKELAIRDGEEHAFYAQYNGIDTIKHAVVAYENNIAIGCGAIKEYISDTMEVKRMFVPLNHRNKRVATQILIALEHWTTELGYKKCILETGIKQPEAIALYKKNNYTIIPNYGQYVGIEDSICFEKTV